MFFLTTLNNYWEFQYSVSKLCFDFFFNANKLHWYEFISDKQKNQFAAAAKKYAVLRNP